MSMKRFIISVLFVFTRVLGMEFGHDSDDEQKKEEKPKLFRTFSSPDRRKPKGKSKPDFSITNVSPAISKKESKQKYTIEKKMISAFQKNNFDRFKDLYRDDSIKFNIEYVLAKLMERVAAANKQTKAFRDLIKKYEGDIDVNKQIEHNNNLKEIAQKTKCQELIELMNGLGMAYYSKRGSFLHDDQKSTDVDQGSECSVDKDDL